MEVTSLYRSISVVPVSPGAVPVATADSVATILPQSVQSVSPVQPAEAPVQTGDQPSGQPGTPPAPDPSLAGGGKLTSRFERDTTTNTMVFMELNTNSGAVVVQFPDEQLLRLRAYLAEVTRREDATKQSVPGSNLVKTM